MVVPIAVLGGHAYLIGSSTSKLVPHIKNGKGTKVLTTRIYDCHCAGCVKLRSDHYDKLKEYANYPITESVLT